MAGSGGHDWRKIFFETLGLEAIRENSNGWIEIRCPLPEHEDSTASAGVNVTLPNGGWNCLGCGEKGGGVDLYGRLRVPGYIPGDRASWYRANDTLHELFGTKKYSVEGGSKDKGKLPTRDELETAQEALLSSNTSGEWPDDWSLDDIAAKPLKFLLDYRRWGIEEIRELRIGWSASDKRFWIPILKNDQLINVRRYQPGAKRNKMMGIWNRNSPAVWPERALKESEIWIMEGEPDAVCARSCGINAVALCTGATSYPKSEVPRFAGKRVVVCFDADMPGRKGAKKLAQGIMKHTPEVKVLDLVKAIQSIDVNPPEEWSGDFTDFVSQGYDVDDLLTYTAGLEPYEAVKSAEEDRSVYRPPLSQSINALYVGRSIEFSSLMVVAMVESPYIVHTEAKIECPAVGSKKACEGCPLSFGSKTYKPNLSNNEILLQVGVTDATKKKVFKEAIGAGCTLFEIDPESDKVSLYEIIVSESVDSWTVDEIDVSSLEFVAYAVGDRFAVNQTYRFEGTTTIDPRTQMSTLLFTKSAPVEDELETFELDPKSELGGRIFELFHVECGVERGLEEAFDAFFEST